MSVSDSASRSPLLPHPQMSTARRLPQRRRALIVTQMRALARRLELTRNHQQRIQDDFTSLCRQDPDASLEMKQALEEAEEASRAMAAGEDFNDPLPMTVNAQVLWNQSDLIDGLAVRALELKNEFQLRARELDALAPRHAAPRVQRHRESIHEAKRQLS